MSFPEADRDFEFPLGQDALGFIDDKGIFDHTDNAHRLLAFWTYQGVYLVDFSYQARPIATEFHG